MPYTRFDAEIIEVIKDSGDVSTGRTISVTRYGGVQEVAGVSRVIEERAFAPWTVGQTLLVFLRWFDRLKSCTLPFGPDAAFEFKPTTKKVRVFARTTFAGRHNGRDAAPLVAEVKAARDCWRLGGLLQLPPTARRTRRPDAVRTAGCQDESGNVTDVLGTYIASLSPRAVHRGSASPRFARCQRFRVQPEERLSNKQLSWIGHLGRIAIVPRFVPTR